MTQSGLREQLRLSPEAPIAEARQKEPEQRFALFTAARTQLQDFVAKNKGKADAALASAELARVTSYFGQALLSKAMREEDDKTRHEKARPAEAMFIQAGKDLEEAVKALEAAVKEASNAELKSFLQTGLKIFQGHQQHAERVAAELK